MSRFDLLSIFRGQWRGLSRGIPPDIRPDWFSRVVILLTPVTILASSLVWHWNMAAPTAMLAGVALLAGGLLSSFTYLSTLRMKVTEWSEDKPERWATERAMLDETAAHILAAASACVIEAVLLVSGMSLAEGPSFAFGGVMAAISFAVASYIAIMFLICLPRLYNAYVELNDVSTELSGFTRGRL